MARRTGGKSRSLYVPEQVSESTYRPLLKEPAVQEVVKPKPLIPTLVVILQFPPLGNKNLF